jgi:nucleoside-diphosphate-sugar epimerase
LDTNGVRLSLGHVDDVVRAFLKLVDAPLPGPINVTSPEVLSIREIAAHIAEAVGVAPRFEMAAAPREGDVVANTSRLRELVNPPFASLASSIRDVVQATVERSGT